MHPGNGRNLRRASTQFYKKLKPKRHPEGAAVYEQILKYKANRPRHDALSVRYKLSGAAGQRRPSAVSAKYVLPPGERCRPRFVSVKYKAQYTLCVDGMED